MIVGKLRFLLICGVLALEGCTTTTTQNLGAPVPDAARTQPSSAATADEDNLFLSIVQGLIEQRRQGAALAFLDSYSASGRTPSPRYWLLRGNALLGLGRNPEAFSAFAMLDDTPLAAHGWNGKGRTAASAKDWQTAAADFDEAVKKEPADADFLNNLAFADMRLGKPGDSATWLRQAHELAPNSDLIRNNLIIALTLKGDRNGADAVLATIGDGAKRDAARASVKKAIETETFNSDGKQ